MAAMWFRQLPPPLVVLLLVCLPGAQPARAQRVAIATAAPGGPGATDILNLATGQTRRISDEPADLAFFTADGSVLIWHPSGRTGWRATAVDAGIDISLPANFIPSGAVHPRELAIFGTLSGVASVPLARLDAQGLHAFDVCPGGGGVVGFDVVPDGSRLVVSCHALFQPSSPTIAHVDAVSGAVLRRTPVSPSAIPSAVVVTDDHYILAAWDGSIVLERRRLSDDQLVGTTSIPVARSTMTYRRLLTPNPGWRDRPVMAWCPEISALPTTTYGCQVAALDAASLTVASTLQPAGPLYPAVSVTADGRQVLVSGVATASLVDVATGQPAIAAAAPANGFIVAAWGAEPQAPVLAQAVVSGNAVMLSWALPVESTAATGYRLEAGSQPGAANILTTGLGPTPSFGAAGVPPGRYHVRVRAVNANGTSHASNEVIVDVP